MSSNMPAKPAAGGPVIDRVVIGRFVDRHDGKDNTKPAQSDQSFDSSIDSGWSTDISSAPLTHSSSCSSPRHDFVEHGLHVSLRGKLHDELRADFHRLGTDQANSAGRCVAKAGVDGLANDAALTGQKPTFACRALRWAASCSPFCSARESSSSSHSSASANFLEIHFGVELHIERRRQLGRSRTDGAENSIGLQLIDLVRLAE